MISKERPKGQVQGSELGLRILLFGGFLIALIFYVFQADPYLPRWFSILFIGLDVMYIFYLLKEIQLFRSTEGKRRQWKTGGVEGYNTQMNEFSRYRLGFSRDVVEQAEDLLAPVENLQNDNLPEKRFFDERSFISRPNHPETSFNAQEKSMLESIPNEWPERSVLRDRSREQFSLRESIARESHRLSKGASDLRPLNRSSMSKSKNTVSKASVNFRNESRQRNLSVAELDETELTLSSSLVALKIDYKRFRDWSEGEIQRWMTGKFLPEIIRRNVANLKAINDLLIPFKVSIVEFQQFSRISESKNEDDLVNSMFERPQNRGDSAFRQISIDDLLCLQINSVYKWGSIFKVTPENSHQVKDNLNKLLPLLNQRVVLDRYLCPKGFRAEQTRLGVFRQLVRFQQETLNAFEVAYEAQNFIPSDEEILLNLFVCLVVECVPFYQGKPSARDLIFIENTYGIFPKAETQFIIEIGDKNKYSCYSGKSVVRFLNGMNGAFAVMVFFAYHVKYKQGFSDSGNTSPAFKTFMSEFDLKPENETRRFF